MSGATKRGVAKNPALQNDSQNDLFIWNYYTIIMCKITNHLINFLNHLIIFYKSFNNIPKLVGNCNFVLFLEIFYHVITKIYN